MQFAIVEILERLLSAKTQNKIKGFLVQSDMYIDIQ